MLNGSEPLIELQGAGLRRGGKWLVHSVDLAIKPRETVTLIGPNGSGKSITAKLALGTLTPDRGSARRVPGLRIGYVPQKLNIDWTVPLRLRRFMQLAGPLSEDDAHAALRRVGIADLANVEVRTLSGGEFQRALLARAVARRPDLLVLDEPVQGVDYTGQIALYELISALRDELGCGILLISHDLHVVMAASDTVLCLNGHVCCRGAPDAVVQHESYLRLFGAHATSALALYRHHHDHTHAASGEIVDGTCGRNHAHESDPVVPKERVSGAG